MATKKSGKSKYNKPYQPKTLRKRTKPKGHGGKKKKPNFNIVRPTIEDLWEADRQYHDLTISGRKDNGEALKIVMISAEELKMAGYRLAVGGDRRKGRYYTVRDEHGFFTLDGQAVFCLKGKQGLNKIHELIEKGFFNSPRLQHKDKL